MIYIIIILLSILVGIIIIKYINSKKSENFNICNYNNENSNECNINDKNDIIVNKTLFTTDDIVFYLKQIPPVQYYNKLNMKYKEVLKELKIDENNIPIQYGRKESSFFDKIGNCTTNKYKKSEFKLDFVDFKNIYMKNISEYTGELDEYLEDANNILEVLFKRLKAGEEDLYWNFKYIKNIEYEMPFTFGSIIYLPKSIIDKSKDNIIATLVHEKIHVLQRKYRLFFEKEYEKLFPFFSKGFNLYRQIYFSNPDGLDINWQLIDIDKKVYTPVLEIVNDNVVYSFYRDGNRYDLSDIKLTDIWEFKSGWYHPNELYAYLYVANKKKLYNNSNLNKKYYICDKSEEEVYKRYDRLYQ